MSDSELARDFRVTDMMLSIHSRLANRFRKRALALDLLTLFGAVVLNAMVWVEFSPAEATERQLFGLTSILIFFLTLASMQLDWKAAAERHERACRDLTTLKGRIRDLPETPTPDAVALHRQEYQGTMAGLIPIPEKDFLALKAYHLRKIALSRLVSAHPATPVWVLRLRLMSADTQAVFRITSGPDK